MKRIRVVAIQMENEKIVVMKTELPQMIDFETLKNLVLVEDYIFYISLDGKEIEFKFNDINSKLEQPTPEQLALLPKL